VDIRMRIVEGDIIRSEGAYLIVRRSLRAILNHPNKIESVLISIINR
jgi:hypothetical protein